MEQYFENSKFGNSPFRHVKFNIQILTPEWEKEGLPPVSMQEAFLLIGISPLFFDVLS